ncbi:hypothetical protein LTS08_003832 [Lithohypha guttulata]|uniref:uncharacterized protein n=1 Tax=Lithohypha guttulata TaxID=1690604 RepID=UPI002DDE5CBA|nr:hypothetical protein LTS08_003832 [Lithohypha guttulata]
MSSTRIQAAQRYVGDGLDYRRPTSSAIAQTEQHTTIDLTQDDDEDDNQNPPPNLGQRSPSFAPSDFSLSVPATSRATSSRPRSRSAPSRQSRSRAANLRSRLPEIIDMTGDEDETDEEEDHNSDVEFVSERQAPRRPVLPVPDEIARRLHSPGAPNLHRANAQTFADSFRPFTNFLANRRPAFMPALGGFGGTGFIDHVGRIMAGFPRNQVPEPLDLATYDDIDVLGDYDDIQLDYAGAAFMIDDPGADIGPADNYKPPAAARKGFTRNIEEDGDVLVCVGCEDELATGDDEDIKAQVWVSKKCGHVYCGGCASRRVAYRKGNDRDRRKTKYRKLDELKECSVDGCRTRLTGKTAMFQIYL